MNENIKVVITKTGTEYVTSVQESEKDVTLSGVLIPMMVAPGRVELYPASMVNPTAELTFSRDEIRYIGEIKNSTVLTQYNQYVEQVFNPPEEKVEIIPATDAEVQMINRGKN